MKQHNTTSKTLTTTLIFVFLFCANNLLFAQELPLSKIKPTATPNSSISQKALIFSGKYDYTEFSWNINLLPVSSKHAFNISTKDNRGINFLTGLGNVLFFPPSSSLEERLGYKPNKIGVHIDNPSYTFDMIGDSRIRVNTNQGNLQGVISKSSLSKQQDSLIGVGGMASDITSLENNNKFSSYPSNTPIGKKKPMSSSKPILKTPESIAAGGSFIVNIADPIPSNKTDIGIYRIGGMVSLLQGNINNYPQNGAVAAVFGEDQINGEQTFAGYFNGKVAIGTNDVPMMTTVGGEPYLFFLNGGGMATEFRVKQGPWPDYVFAADYIRPTIEEEIQYIQENGHLMGFQSAEEMGEYMELGDVTVRQQTKIEEMRLDMFEMYKENQNLKTELKKLQEDNVFAKCLKL